MFVIGANDQSDSTQSPQIPQTDVVIKLGERQITVDRVISITNSRGRKYIIDDSDLILGLKYGAGELSVKYDVLMNEISVCYTGSQAISVYSNGDLSVMVSNEGPGSVLALNNGPGTFCVLNTEAGKIRAYNNGPGTLYTSYGKGDRYDTHGTTCIVTNPQEGWVQAHKGGLGTVGLLIEGVEVPVIK